MHISDSLVHLRAISKITHLRNMEIQSHALLTLSGTWSGRGKVSLEPQSSSDSKQGQSHSASRK